MCFDKSNISANYWINRYATNLGTTPTAFRQ